MEVGALRCSHLNCLLNSRLAVVLLHFPDFDSAHDDVESVWFNLSCGLIGDCGGQGGGLFSKCTDPGMTNFPCPRWCRVRHGGLIP